MKATLFNKLYKDAAAQPDRELFIAEYGSPEWFDDISQDINDVIGVLNNIHYVANLPMKDLIKSFGTQQAFADRFCVPKRTVENWGEEKNNCPAYTKLMIAEILGILKVKRE